MRFSLTFGRNSQLIWALILPAFLMLIPLLMVMEYILPELPQSDWMPIIISLAYMGTTLWMTLKWVKATTASVEISADNGAVSFVFPKKNIFHRKDLRLSFNEIINLGEDDDKDFSFLYFETTNPHYPKFHIAAPADNEDFIEFSRYVSAMQAEYNAHTSPGKIITNRSIYQKWPMKALACVFITAWFIIPFLPQTSDHAWLMNAKYWVFVVLSSPIIIKVYNQNFGKQTK